MSKEYSFSIYVKYPDNCKITINDKEISSISVPSGTLINWKIEKNGYKTERGEVTLYSDLEYMLKLQLQQPKFIDPSTEYYTKIIQDKDGNYQLEITPIDNSSIPSVEGHDEEFLSNKNGNLIWKKFDSKELFSPTEKDNNKYLQWNGEDFVFNNPLPELPDVSSDYVLHHVGGNLEWILDGQSSINWGNITGDISEQEDLVNILSEMQNDINSTQLWTSSFKVEGEGLEFINNTLSIKDDYLNPIKNEISSINQTSSDLKRRHILFEKATDFRFNQRATAPDYSQIQELPELNRYNMFTISKFYWAIVESSNPGDELQVYDAVRSVEGNPIEPLLDKFLATIYRNTSSSGKDLKYILLTKSYFYKLSNPETMHITLIGEMPYGETP